MLIVNNSFLAFYKLESTQIQLGKHSENSHLSHGVVEGGSK